MTLATRLGAFFLAVLALVLLGFSLAIYFWPSAICIAIWTVNWLPASKLSWRPSTSKPMDSTGIRPTTGP